MNLHDDDTLLEKFVELLSAPEKGGIRHMLQVALRLSGIKLFAHRFLPKIPPLSAFTTPPLRLPVSLLFPNFAIWQGNPPKSPLIPRCVGQKWQTPSVLGQFG